MYGNLEAEISRRRMPKYVLAQKIGVSASTLYQKLNGKSSFTLPEARKIKEALGTNGSIDFLFETSENKTSA